MVKSHGKWSIRSFPHKGWSCSGIEDLGGANSICEMCETQEIRFVHNMIHTDYEGILGVGCVCAGHMEQDLEAPRLREQQLRNSAQRKSKWLSRKWRSSKKGNSYLNTDGFNITIFLKDDGTWGGKLTDKQTEQFIYSKRKYSTQDQAKLAAFDAMIFLKNKRGWGT